MTKKRSPILPIILSVMIGLLVIALLTSVLNPVPVIVANGSIAPGTILIHDLIEVRNIPAQARPENAIVSIDDAVGKMVSVGRGPGDFITSDVLGDVSESGIPSQLNAGHVAMAITIDLASGIGGVLRPGQQVSIIGMIPPEVLQFSQNRNNNLNVSIPSEPISDVENSGYIPTLTPTPTSMPPQGVLSRVMITGLKVLLVPQSFRYEELPASTSEEALFANARMASSSQGESIVVLDVPIQTLELWEGYFVNPASLLALLNEYGKIHLVLDSTNGLDIDGSDMLTLNLADLYNQMGKESIQAEQSDQINVPTQTEPELPSETTIPEMTPTATEVN